MNKKVKNKKFYLLGLVLFFYGVLVIPLMVLNNQSKQELRGNAQVVTPTQTTCGNAATDTVIIIDRSGSMQPANKLPPTKTAAKNFIDIIATDNRNRVSLVTFSTAGVINKPLTSDFASVKSSVDSIQAEGWTCVECAIKLANQEIAAHGRPGIKKVIVLLTDGQANYIEGSSQQQTPAVADKKAFDAAKSGYGASQSQFFTIGLGDPNATGNERFFNPELLKNIADATGGKFYFPLPNELDDVYNAISLLIGKATVGGFVFNDANGNKLFDTGEAKLANQTVTLSSSTWGTKTATTDSNGNYLFTQVCDGPYSLKFTPQSGWIQTVPTDPNGYSITVTNGFSVLEKNFGAKVAPPTVVPSATPVPATELSLTVFLDGIGNRGDNTNPTQSSLSNKNPLHPTINADVQIFDSTNKLVSDGAGTITYDKNAGNYKGTITVAANALTTGPYTVKVKAVKYLRKTVPGIQNITVGKANEISPVSLVAGDIKIDNRLDILDYNFLLDCYSDLKDAANCGSATSPTGTTGSPTASITQAPSSGNKKDEADMNDDGAVNQVDYNLFLREISTQPGQ